ncbi:MULTISPECIES: phosphodiesterase [Halomonadaceae]|uniref:phosphodiesterase n=1 Tax=Halomonadaceae TaxID=28256 RepID=UPI001598E2FC|nr:MULTISPECIES: phosphodiesterase [Halomonas]QJQ95232.1 phosphodiesterase [Halomonas sp. PA5]
MRLLQVTDCHLYADPQGRSRAGFPLRQLHAVVAHARKWRPDMLLVTGDVSQDDTPASYQHAYAAFATLGCPWFWLPGNHDQQQHMTDIQPLHREVDLGGWRLVLLDTQVSGEPHGELGDEQLLALAERLEGDTRPTLLAMHHPPVKVGCAWLDAIGLADREAFWQSLAPFAHVKAIVCGHIHQAFVGRQPIKGGEVAVYGSPATADQFLGRAREFAIDQASRPGYRVIDLEGDTLTTWVERVTIGRTVISSYALMG